jgi:ABC-type branched-subunit amino acid transport system substrate-binding protein
VVRAAHAGDGDDVLALRSQPSQGELGAGAAVALVLLSRLLASLGLFSCAQAFAGEVVIAQVAPFSGPLASNGEANWLGAHVYFERVNALGGVNGSTVRFVREDDRYVDSETVRLVEQVIARDKPLAFVNLLGSANVRLLMEQRVLERAVVPAVGVTPGADRSRCPTRGRSEGSADLERRARQCGPARPISRCSTWNEPAAATRLRLPDFNSIAGATLTL